jgi:hypothetical protein
MGSSKHIKHGAEGLRCHAAANPVEPFDTVWKKGGAWLAFDYSHKRFWFRGHHRRAGASAPCGVGFWRGRGVRDFHSIQVITIMLFLALTAGATGTGNGLILNYSGILVRSGGHLPNLNLQADYLINNFPASKFLSGTYRVGFKLVDAAGNPASAELPASCRMIRTEQGLILMFPSEEGNWTRFPVLFASSRQNSIRRQYQILPSRFIISIIIISMYP